MIFEIRRWLRRRRGVLHQSSARNPGCSRSPGWHSRAACGCPGSSSTSRIRHPEGSGGQRVVPTENLVDLPDFGRARRNQPGDLSVCVMAPVGLSAAENDALVRRA
jgi:hypothetical protein